MLLVARTASIPFLVSYRCQLLSIFLVVNFSSSSSVSVLLSLFSSWTTVHAVLCGVNHSFILIETEGGLTFWFVGNFFFWWRLLFLAVLVAEFSFFSFLSNTFCFNCDRLFFCLCDCISNDHALNQTRPLYIQDGGIYKSMLSSRFFAVFVAFSTIIFLHLTWQANKKCQRWWHSALHYFLQPDLNPLPD